MPIYEYQCGKCHADFELLVRGDEKPECPECHSKRLERKLSVVASPNMNGAVGTAPDPGICGRPQCGMYGCQGMN
jgi:putative FmdB family regulatory protein